MPTLTAVAWFLGGVGAVVFALALVVISDPYTRFVWRRPAEPEALRPYPRDPNRCQWPADGHFPSGSAGASTDWIECGVPSCGWHASTPAAITLSVLPVCAEHLETARGVWTIHPPAEADDNPLDHV